MQRFYLPQTLLGSQITLRDTGLYHQLTRVLRARVGEQVIFFDGVSLRDEVYEIATIDKQSVKCQKIQTLTKNSELTYSLHLFQALPHKLEKLEYIIEKGVEIGYRSFTFFPSERSQKLVLSDNKKARLEKIAQEALEQCGGNIIPQIEFYEENIIFSTSVPGVIRHIFCHTSGAHTQKLSDISLDSENQVGVYIGPEGGFSENEVEMMRDKGYTGVYFGSRILRCETVSSVVGFYLKQKKGD